MADVILPQLGETVTEGTITQWFKSVGDTVAEDEPLFEVSTDKVDTEVPSPVSGTLTEIRVEEGDTVDVGTVIAVVGDADGAAPAAPAAEPAAAAAPAPARCGSGRSPASLLLLLLRPQRPLRSQSRPPLRRATIACSRRSSADSSTRTASTPTPLPERVPEVASLAMTCSITSTPRAPEPLPQHRLRQRPRLPRPLQQRHLPPRRLPLHPLLPHPQSQLANVTARSVCPRSASSPVLTW